MLVCHGQPQTLLKSSFGNRPFLQKVRTTVSPIKIVCWATVDRHVNRRQSKMESLYQIIYSNRV